MSKTKLTNKEVILQAAYELFLGQGYNGSSIRDIADKAKVSLGGIYAHFPNKEAIYAELLMARMPFLPLVEIVDKHRTEDPVEFFKNIAQEWHKTLNIKDFRLIFIDWVEFGGNTCKKILPKIFPQRIAVIKKIIQKMIDAKKIKNYDPFLIFRGFIQMLTIYIVTDDLLSGFSETKKPIDNIVDIYLKGVLNEKSN